MTLEELFAASAAGIDHSNLQEKLTAEMQKTFERVMIDEISGYDSPFKLVIKKKIRAMLGVAGDELDVNVYAHSVSQLLAKQLHDQVTGETQKHLKQVIESITQQAPSTSKLSEIVEIVKEDAFSSGEKCTLQIEEEGCFTRISIDEADNKKDRDCAVRLGFYNGRKSEQEPQDVFVYSYKEKGIHSGFGKLDKAMFWLARCGTKLIVDEDDCNPYYDNDY